MHTEGLHTAEPSRGGPRAAILSVVSRRMATAAATDDFFPVLLYDHAAVSAAEMLNAKLLLFFIGAPELLEGPNKRGRAYTDTLNENSVENLISAVSS